MKGWIRKTWAGCVLALAAGVPVAHADGGTISFTGAVVTPTCSISGTEVSASGTRGADPSGTHFGCSGTADASYSARAPQAYTVSVEALESSSLSSDRLISYFSGYVRAAAEDTHMQLVTQAYE